LLPVVPREIILLSITSSNSPSFSLYCCSSI
jgi:hypothetical protein